MKVIDLTSDKEEDSDDDGSLLNNVIVRKRQTSDFIQIYEENSMKRLKNNREDHCEDMTIKVSNLNSFIINQRHENSRIVDLLIRLADYILVYLIILVLYTGLILI